MSDIYFKKDDVVKVMTVVVGQIEDIRLRAYKQGKSVPQYQC